MREGIKAYGDVVVVFDKNRLMDRTTATMGDSFGAGLNETVMPFRVTSPDIYGYIEGDVQSGWVAKNINELYEDYKRGVNILPTQLTSNPYIELQYHGELTTSDFSEVYWQRGKDPEKAKYQDALKQIMDENGIRWTEYD